MLFSDIVDERRCGSWAMNGGLATTSVRLVSRGSLSVRAVLSGASCSHDEDLRTFSLISTFSLAFSLPLRSLRNSELEWDGDL